MDDNSRLSYPGVSSQSIRRAVKSTYASVYAINENEDLWHEFSTDTIHQFIRNATAKRQLNNLRILNAGAGGLSYGIAGGIHLDFSLGGLLGLCPAVTSDLEHLCIASATIDLAICVGSVINYVSADRALEELSRTIKTRGCLILEYERSESIAYIFSDVFGAHAMEVETYYKGHRHPMFVYSDIFIRDLLAKYGFHEERRLYYHIAPRFLFEAKRFARLIGCLDRGVGKVRVLRRFAANCIVKCRKAT